MSPLSLIVPSKNRPHEVRRAIESVFAKSAMVAEIVVVDQSATAYQLPDDPRIVHVYRPDLTGLTAARNAGVDRAGSEIVLFMDDDCTFESDVAAEVLRQFERDPAVVGVQPLIIDPDYTPPPISQRVFEKGFFDSHNFGDGSANGVRRMSGCSMAFRRSLFQSERFDETLRGYCYGEDWDFSLRARAHGRLVLTETAVVTHRPAAAGRLDRLGALRTRWTNVNYIYRKLRPRASLTDRICHLWWSLGETLVWLRCGLGLPHA